MSVNKNKAKKILINIGCNAIPNINHKAILRQYDEIFFFTK